MIENFPDGDNASGFICAEDSLAEGGVGINVLN
jgi:hypothetical protein